VGRVHDACPRAAVAIKSSDSKTHCVVYIYVQRTCKKDKQ
jgi:hypothetical protein